FLLSPPLPPLRRTLFPYTTLFRSRADLRAVLSAGGCGSRRRWRGPGTRDRAAPGGAAGRGDRVRRSAWRREHLLHAAPGGQYSRSEEHTSELQSRSDLVCRLLLEK